MSIPLSFHTGLLSDLPTADAVRMIRDHGYDMAELNTEDLPWGPAHIRLTTPMSEIDAIAKLGPFSALCIHHRDFGAADPDRRDAATAWTIAMLDRAVDLDISIVHVIPGAEADLPALHDALARGVEAAERKEVTFALEAIVGRIIGTTATALDALDAVPGLAINFDPSHLLIMGDDTVEAARQLGSKSAHMHLKDARGTLDEWAFVPLGTGEIDLVKTTAALVEAGFDGPISIEHESHYFANDNRSVQQVLADCKVFMDQMIAQVRAK